MLHTTKPDAGEPLDYTDENGDVLPVDRFDALGPDEQFNFKRGVVAEEPYYAEADAEDDTEAPTDAEANLPAMTSTLPPEVYEAVYNAAVQEDKDRAKGIRPERIKSRGGLGRELAHLVVRKIDISGAFPPVQREVQPQQHELTPEQEAQVDHLMDTTGLSQQDAERKLFGA